MALCNVFLGGLDDFGFTGWLKFIPLASISLTYGLLMELYVLVVFCLGLVFGEIEVIGSESVLFGCV